MLQPKNVKKITRLMGLTIMQAIKNYKSNRMLRIFGRSNGISKTFVKYMNQLGMSGYSISARNYLKGYSCGKELLGNRHKVFLGTIVRISGYLVITRLTRNKSKNDMCRYLSIGIFRW